MSDVPAVIAELRASCLGCACNPEGCDYHLGMVEGWSMAVSHADLGGPGKHNDSETSRRAASLPHFGSHRWDVLRQLWVRPHDGVTCRVVAQALGKAANQTATRFLELRERGMVEWVRNDHGEFVTRIDPGFQTPARVQRLTEFGAAYYAAEMRRTTREAP